MSTIGRVFDDFSSTRTVRAVRAVVALSPEKREAVRMRVLGASDRRIAQEYGVVEPTVRAWFREPEMQALVALLERVKERTMREQTVGRKDYR